MLVEARAHIRNDLIQRILKKAECEPGERFELPEGEAVDYLKNGLVVPVKKREKAAAPDAAPVAPVAPVAPQFAASAGAPESAVSPRGRGGLTTRSVPFMSSPPSSPSSPSISTEKKD